MSPAVLRDPGALRPWQHDAVATWENAERRGIVAAATGTGKTRVAHAAIARFWEERSRVVIVVPSVALQRQWVAGLMREFGLYESQIGTLGGTNAGIHEGHGFVVAVINSARSGLRNLAAGWAAEGRQIMLIVDECHWAATGQNAEIFDGHYAATLGLSATPERSDDGLDEVLIPKLGDVIFRYGLRDALDDGLLAPLRVINLYFDLTAPEVAELDPVQESITQLERLLIARQPDLSRLVGLERSTALLRASLESNDTRGLKDLYQRRSYILERSQARRAALHDVAASGVLAQQSTIVFHERIEEARSTAAMLHDLGVAVALELSTDPPETREEALRDFRSGLATTLVVVRTVDEGVDLPDAKLAVIMSGSHSLRQRIQRIGRVVRPTGASAAVISLLARRTAEEWIVGENDPVLLGSERVVSARSVSEAVGLLIV